METKYVGPLPADLNDQSRTIKAELRLEPSEAFTGHLAVGVYGHSSGREIALVHLDGGKVDELLAAIQAWKAEQ